MNKVRDVEKQREYYRKYSQSEKGIAARKRATQNYRAKKRKVKMESVTSC